MSASFNLIWNLISPQRIESLFAYNKPSKSGIIVYQALHGLLYVTIDYFSTLIGVWSSHSSPWVWRWWSNRGRFSNGTPQGFSYLIWLCSDPVSECIRLLSCCYLLHLHSFFPSYKHQKFVISSNQLHTLVHSLWPEGPKFKIRSTHARTNWDPNNAFLWGVRRHISKVFITKVGQNGPNWRFPISHVMSMGKNQPEIDVFQHPLY